MQPRMLSVAVSAVLVLAVAAVGADTARATPLRFSQLTQMQKRLLSGVVDVDLNPAYAQAAAAGMRGLNYFPREDDGCPGRRGANVKVNQNCLNVSDPDLQGRGQANNETSLAIDPFHPDHIVASWNDYRRGDGNCYGAFSLDGGRTWADSTVPTSFTRGAAFGDAARQYWQAGGDTSVAWDTRGNAYLDCQGFMRGSPVSSNPDLSSALYVFRSTANSGASWNFPGRPVIESPDLAGTGTAPFEDKPLMTVDNHVESPFRDRVYVTWTEFAADGSTSIWESFSSDYAESFSPKVLVSSDSPLCIQTFGAGTPQGKCNSNQFSQPFTAPDGTLYVVWANFNNATGHPSGDNGDDQGDGGNAALTIGGGDAAGVTEIDNHNQILLAKSTDGGKSFSAPVKVADYYDLPDCATYQANQDVGRACVPEKGSSTRSVFRATNYPAGVVNPRDTAQVIVSFGSYLNRNSNEKNGCIPTGVNTRTGVNTYTGVKTSGACNNDILISVSNNGGQTFTGTSTNVRNLPSVTNAPRQRSTDQWWQWIAFSTQGRLVISYYDRQYGDDEMTGDSDFSLSGASNNHIDNDGFGTVRVTSSSLPPPTQFPDAQGNSTFWGDYTGLAAARQAFPIWSDTRGADVFICPGTAAPGIPPALCQATTPSGVTANDQDIYTQGIDVPADAR